MVTTRCRRCDRPLAADATCRSCGPPRVGLIGSAAPWPDEPAWPRARRWLDDVAPRRDRRPLVAAMTCLIVAALLITLALA